MLSDSQISKHESEVNSLGNLVDEYRDLKKERDTFFSALESISTFNEGLLGGNDGWEVGHWHDYIRSIIGEIQQIAKDVL